MSSRHLLTSFPTASRNGVIKMLELRGPAAIQNDLDRSILRVQTGNIFTNAIRDRTSCFLADPEWIPVLEDAMLGASQRDDVASAEFSAMVLAGLRFPGIICRYEEVQSTRTYDSTNPVQQATMLPGDAEYHKLMADLLEARSLLADWRTRYDPGEKRCCYTSTQEGETTRRIWHASRLSVNTFCVMVDYMLATLCGGDSVELTHLALHSGERTHTAKSELQVLRLTDAIAAMETTMLLRMMLTRVIDASRSCDDKPQLLRPVIDDLFDHLEEGT